MWHFYPRLGGPSNPDIHCEKKRDGREEMVFEIQT